MNLLVAATNLINKELDEEDLDDNTEIHQDT